MKQSAGILLYRIKEKQLQIFLVHPGGPFWKNKDAGAWSIPKGEYETGEDAFATAKKEFEEETGQSITGNFISLNTIKQKSGKLVIAWAVEGDINELNIKSNEFEMEWPPRSGKKIKVPEVDKGGWFTVEEAKIRINIAQVGLIDQLLILKKVQGS